MYASDRKRSIEGRRRFGFAEGPRAPASAAHRTASLTDAARAPHGALALKSADVNRLDRQAFCKFTNPAASKPKTAAFVSGPPNAGAMALWNGTMQKVAFSMTGPVASVLGTVRELLMPASLYSLIAASNALTTMPVFRAASASVWNESRRFRLCLLL